MNKTVAIIQARLGSTRLPRKVLRYLAGETVLGHVVARVRQCPDIDEVVVATTMEPEDDAIVNDGMRLGVRVTRGSESDVLSRYYDAAMVTNADLIVRVTSDCPLIDPRVISLVVQQLKDSRRDTAPYDYTSNTHPRSFPHGLDVEVFSRCALISAFAEATERYEREHVTPFFYLHPDRFRIGNVEQKNDQSLMRWTLDEPSDWSFFEAIFAGLPRESFPSTEQVLKLLKENPYIQMINSSVHQKGLKAA